MRTIFVKPAAGRRVLDPDATPPAPLPAEGKSVPKAAYWLRRIKEGSVIESSPPKTPRPAKQPDIPAKGKE
jgi:hypothetical protein